MTFWTLALRSLRFHARAHLGVLLGATVGAAVLIGALLVGDSVRGSLREMALARLGKTHYALQAGDRFVTDGLERFLAGRGYSASAFLKFGWGVGTTTPFEVAPLLQLGASVSTADGSGRANRAWVYGVNEAIVGLGADARLASIPSDAVMVNRALAVQLGAKVGDMVVLRVSKPSTFAKDAAIAKRDDSSFALRLRVRGIVDQDGLGNLSMLANQAAPLSAFVALEALQRAAGIPYRANLLLTEARRLTVTGDSDSDRERLSLEDVNQRLGYCFGLDDVQLQVSALRYPYPERRLGPPAQLLGPDGQPIRSGLRQDQALDRQLLIASHALGLLPGPELDTNGNPILPQVDGPVPPTEPTHQLTSPRVFLDPPAIRAAFAADTNARPILTYLVNLIQAGERTTPYSMVTAAGAPFVPDDLRDDEVVINQWLAEDLKVGPGAEVALTYFRSDSGAQLAEATNRFRVRSVVPMKLPWVDQNLMPEFPGIASAEQVGKWDAGFPLQHKVRKVDDEYWKVLRGAPKAFVSLSAGRKMWASRFGDTTAITFHLPPDKLSAPALDAAGNPVPQAVPNTVQDIRTVEEKLGDAILARLKPADFGLVFQPVREQALKASGEGQDFGGLFIGFSFFLIIAACVLVSLLFQFGVEQRATEVGTLLALGFTPRQVRRLFLLEGAGLSLIGSLLGAAGGVWYAQAMLHALSTVWRDAVGTSDLSFHAGPATLAGGIVGSVLVAVFTLWLALRKQARRPARELLAGGGEGEEAGLASGGLGLGNGARLGLRRQAERDAALASRGAESAAPPDEKAPSPLRSVGAVQKGRAFLIGVVCLLGALGLSGWAWAKQDSAAAGIFFGAGALLLGAAMAFTSAFLSKLERSEAAANLTLTGLGIRNATRRRRRSMATVAMLACGSFLIVSIGAFRLDENADATKRASGTGGFALLGESTLPVVQDLNSPAGREFFNLDAKTLTSVSVVPFRVRDGDDASCLNLNRAQKPRLLGVKPGLLAERGAFKFAGAAKGLDKGEGWKLLSGKVEGLKGLSVEGASVSTLQPFNPSTNSIPAIADEASILWALGKKLGDTLDFTDERGKPFKVRLVAALAGSVLQGNLIIAEDEFTARYPGEAGYRFFLVDAPPDRAADVSAALTKGLRDSGLELVPTTRRLAQFNAVQNTYLGTFQVLGGLGLLLGSAGLGVVVLRNVLERRGELALLLAVGFRAKALRWLVLSEHAGLLLLGLGAGVVAAAVAVLPALRSGGDALPLGTLGLTLAGVLVSGLVFTLLATTWSLRGRLLDSLRNQ